MKEKLYTIPVNDAFNEDHECPICNMKHTLETNAIDYVMGPSYMEDDVRAETDKLGFCDNHLKLMYKNQNRLGLSLMLNSHLDYTTKQIKKLSESSKPSAPGLFKKKTETSELKAYIDKLADSCFVCSRIENTFDRYIVTILQLYKTDQDFRTVFKKSKGFCTQHYGVLFEQAPKYFNSELTSSFLKELNDIYLSNMSRVKEDLDWFIDKFDYRYVNEPWKNSQDALPRTAIKTNSVTEL